MKKHHSSRRNFIEFLGKGVIATALLPTFATGCKTVKSTSQSNTAILSSLNNISGIPPNHADDVILPEGLSYEVLLKWGDAISAQDQFGYNNDYIAFIPLDNDHPNEGLLWVNHEYISPKFVSGYKGGERTKEQVTTEMYHVGGSIVRVKKKGNNKWEIEKGDAFNRRISGLTDIPFNWSKDIAGKSSAMGTLGNCSGGITPWGTILTCEENYDAFYGERDHATGAVMPSALGWEKFYDNPPEHYGWVVEVNPKTGECKKHVALGRCAHECATIKQLDDGRLVVYTGDDSTDECLYKFVSAEAGSLEKGTLYVANTEKGEWVSLDYETQTVLQENFKHQTEVLIRLREAAKLVGGTPLDRPEDIEIDPVTGSVLIALTNNKPKGNYFGSILKIEETDGAHDALTFTSDTYLAGGEETGFACPDNMAFDLGGNLWFTSDISGSKVGKEPYTAFQNNGLFLVPRMGDLAGKVIQIASAPKDAEFTGPFFAPNGDLFLSVQHPGETSPSLAELSSNWPDGGNHIPKSSVIVISGENLRRWQGIA